MSTERAGRSPRLVALRPRGCVEIGVQVPLGRRTPLDLRDHREPVRRPRAPERKPRASCGCSLAALIRSPRSLGILGSATSGGDRGSRRDRWPRAHHRLRITRSGDIFGASGSGRSRPCPAGPLPSLARLRAKTGTTTNIRPPSRAAADGAGQQRRDAGDHAHGKAGHGQEETGHRAASSSNAAARTRWCASGADRSARRRGGRLSWWTTTRPVSLQLPVVLGPGMLVEPRIGPRVVDRPHLGLGVSSDLGGGICVEVGMEHLAPSPHRHDESPRRPIRVRPRALRSACPQPSQFAHRPHGTCRRTLQRPGHPYPGSPERRGSPLTTPSHRHDLREYECGRGQRHP